MRRGGDDRLEMGSVREVEAVEEGGYGGGGDGRRLDLVSKSRDLERYVDGDEGRDRERERDRERRRRELLETLVWGTSVGAVIGRSEYVDMGGGNAAVG